jgi:hypothetical protein
MAASSKFFAFMEELAPHAPKRPAPTAVGSGDLILPSKPCVVFDSIGLMGEEVH